jgi:hypothetical protein
MRRFWETGCGRGTGSHVRAASIATLVSAAALLSGACSVQGAEELASSDDSLTSGQPPAPVLFAPTTKRVVIEIDYAPGAEPFEGSPDTYADPWKLFRDNANAVFDRKVELVVPDRVARMERLDDIEGTVFGREELVAIAKKHRDVASTSDTVSLYVLYLNGAFKESDGRVLRSTVGISVRGTGIIAMFKPGITVGFRDPVSPILMEQTTLIHEFGHAIGLVDVGVPAISRHRDDAHGAHCSNPSCVMYFRNDMVKEGVDFVRTYLAPNHGVLFGRECLADAHALAKKSGGAFASLVAQSSPALAAEPATLIVDE